MPKGKRSRKQRAKTAQAGTSNPSISPLALPMPTSGKVQTDYIKRQYNVLDKIEIIGGSDAASRTISLIGAKDSGVDARCKTIGDANYNDALKNDMGRNQWFRIYRVQVHVVFSPATDQNSTCCALETATSAYEIFRPDLNEDKYAALTTYSMLAVPQSTLTRTFNFNPMPFYNALGIEWCPCKEWPDFQDHKDTYMDQLKAGYGPSIFLNWRRHGLIAETREVSRLWITYFVEYKGQKGSDDIS